MELNLRTAQPGLAAMDAPRARPRDPRARSSRDAATRVLMVEEMACDAALIQHHLRKAGMTIEVLRVETRQGLIAALRNFRPDVILSDCLLQDLNGLEAVKLARELAPGVPVIMVTGVLADNIIVNLLDVGAHDYVLKDRLARLAPAVERALADVRQCQLREQIEAALQAFRARFQALAASNAST